MKHVRILLLAVVVTGCASLRGPNDAQVRYREGMDALARGDFVAATGPLEFASRSSDSDLSRRALMLLATAELDPTNPSRSLDGAVELAARLRASSTAGSPEHITAAALERIAGETRTLKHDLAEIVRDRDSAWLTIDSLQTRITALVSQRDSVSRKAVQLQVVNDSLTDELKKKTQELDRIRRAIRG